MFFSNLPAGTRAKPTKASSAHSRPSHSSNLDLQKVHSQRQARRRAPHHHTTPHRTSYLPYGQALIAFRFFYPRHPSSPSLPLPCCLDSIRLDFQSLFPPILPALRLALHLRHAEITIPIDLFSFHPGPINLSSLSSSSLRLILPTFNALGPLRDRSNPTWTSTRIPPRTLLPGTSCSHFFFHLVSALDRYHLHRSASSIVSRFLPTLFLTD